MADGHAVTVEPVHAVADMKQQLLFRCRHAAGSVQRTVFSVHQSSKTKDQSDCHSSAKTLERYRNWVEVRMKDTR